MPLTLHWRSEDLVIARFPPAAPLPPIPAGAFFSLTRTGSELSLVIATEHLPAGATAVEAGWRAVAVVGPLDFSLVGILSGLASTLAAAGVSLFALSTYDTDLILVRTTDKERATTALLAAGYRLTDGLDHAPRLEETVQCETT
ncbi:MAG: hypothetical protein ACI8RZ_007535 [Myxococcota bacterium]|jgi:hypothetical protein